LKYFHKVVKEWHRNVVNVVASYVSLVSVFVVEEFCEAGTLSDFIYKQKGHFDEVQVWNFFT